MKTFFIADMHFDDERILSYENRPFESVKDMNEKLISNFNSTVSDEDKVYILGDVGNEAYIHKLNGKKYLIKGNHDVFSNEAYRNAGFEEVYDLPVVYEGFWILSHEPLYVCENMPYANIFGHVHASPVYKDYSSQHFCVSVERIDYRPVSFEEIKQKVME